MRSICLICLVFISIYSYGQKINSKHHNQQIDSCRILKNLISTKLKYHKIGNYYHDSTGLFYFYKFDLYPAFRQCILNKDTTEIKEIFGEPSYIWPNIYKYCLLPTKDISDCEDYITIKFNNKWIVKDITKVRCIIQKCR